LLFYVERTQKHLRKDVMKPFSSISTKRLFGSISIVVLSCLVLAAPAGAERFKQTINISVSPNPTIGSTSSYNPLTYKVEGETEQTETYGVYTHILELPEEAACPAQPTGNYLQVTIPEVKVHETSLDPSHFEGEGTLPWNMYGQKGEYRICAYLKYKGEHAPQNETVINTTVLTVTESYAEYEEKEAAKKANEEKLAAEKKASEEKVAVEKKTHEEEAVATKKHEEEAAAKKKEEEAKNIGTGNGSSTNPSTSSTTPITMATTATNSLTAPVVTPVVVKPQTESKLVKALKQCKKLKKHSKRVVCEKRAKKKYKR